MFLISKQKGFKTKISVDLLSDLDGEKALYGCSKFGSKATGEDAHPDNNCTLYR